MLQILPDLEFLLSYFLLELFLPLLIFLAFLFPLLYLQSRIVLGIYYRIVLPELRKNHLLYWLIGWPAVASHELLGHALIGAVTGSTAELHEVISPERGAVKIFHRRTAWGYLSALLATLAPSFALPLILLGVFHLLFPGLLSLTAPDLPSVLSLLFSNLLPVLAVLFNSDLSNPPTLLFIYLLSTLSLTAGASKTDFRIILESTRRFWYFALFLLLVFSLGLEPLRAILNLAGTGIIFYSLSSLFLLSFLLMLLGASLSVLLALYLRRMQEFGFLQKLLAALAFPALYLPLIYSTLSFPPLPPYFAYLLLSLLFALLFQSLLKFAASLLNPPPRKPREVFKRLRK